MVNTFSIFFLLFYQELADIKASGLKSFRDIAIDETNILNWTGVIVPVNDTNILLTSFQVFIFKFTFHQENPPYNKGAFRIEITFPAEYPFKPPKICFKTKIYHPNIDEKGQVCLPIISAENWKPATKTDQGNLNIYIRKLFKVIIFLLVIQALVALVNDPEPEHPLRADLAEEYLKDRKKFIKNAEEYVKKYSEKRPAD